MSRPVLVTIALVVVALATAVALVLVARAESRRVEPQPVVTPRLAPPPPTTWPPLPAGTPRSVPQVPPTGRHHPETVRAVPADWMPVTGEQRLRALEQTRQMPRLPREGGTP